MRRHALLTAALLTGVVLTLHPSAGVAQGVDMGPSECFSCKAAPSAPAYSPPPYQPSPAEIAAQQAEQARQQRLKEAHTANEQGLALYNNRDWSRALASFQEAAAKSPDDPIIRENLAHAREAVAQEQAQLENQRRDKAAAVNMQKAIQGFAQTLKAVPAAGGLDFDGGNSSSSSGTGTSSGLDFATTVKPAIPVTPAAVASGDPSVVDERNAPSGLSKPVENAIAGAYASAPPGVSDRVRKGFQAVETGDWKVAKAWFEDALSRDPGNADLKRLLAAINEPPKGAAPAAGHSPPAGPKIHGLATLNANAGKMSTPEIMDSLGDIIAEHIFESAVSGN